PFLSLPRVSLSPALIVPTRLRPPRPRSPLFPYTTLFRSYDAPKDETGVNEQVDILDSVLTEAALAGKPYVLCLAAVDMSSCEAQDRKSTRLNSSHVSISYAVFCLKKKSEGHITPRVLHAA